MNLTDDDCIGTTPEIGDQDDDFIYIQDQGSFGPLTNFDIFDGAGDVRTLTYSVDNGSTSIALSAGSPGIKTIDCNTPCTVDWNHGGSSGSFTYHFSGGSGTFSTGDTTPPTVTSIARQTPATSPTSADTLVFQATFSEDVQNVGTADFEVSGTSTAMVTDVTGTGDTYSVTVSGGNLASFNGTVGVRLHSGQDIADLAGNDLTDTSIPSNQTYTLDNAGPVLAEETAVPDPTVDGTPDYTFSTSETGTLSVGSGCGTSSSTTISSTGNQTITLTKPDNTSALDPGTYNCTLQVTDGLGNISTPLSISQFEVIATTPPLFSKAFSPDNIAENGTSTLTFTIDNTANAVAATSLDFTDNLPAGLAIATPANASTTCTGGTMTAVAASGTFSYTGGTVAANASCTLQVDVVASSVGGLVNTTGDLTSSLGNSGTASDTLTVNAAPEIEVVETGQGQGAIADGGTLAQGTQTAGASLTLTFTVTNNGSADLTIATATSSALDNVTVNSISAPTNTTVSSGGGTETFTVQYTPTLAGAFSFGLSFTNDDSDEDPYNFTVSGTATGTPEISVDETGLNQGPVADGGTLAQGTQSEGSPVTLTFTVKNSGTADLTIATATSSSLANVTVNSISAPSNTTVTAGDGTETFTVQYTPTASGAFSFDLSFTNDDSDENPFNFTVSGSTIGVPTGIAIQSGDGQSTEISTAFGNVLEALVTDTNSNGVPGELVTFTAPASGPSLTFASTGTNTETVLTDANGVATSSALTANAEASPFTGGAYTPYDVTASIAGPFTATFSMTNTRDSAADIAQTQDVIAAFVTNRADRIVSSQPNLVNRLSGGPFSQPNNANASVGPNSQSFDLQVSLRAYAEQRRQDAAALPPTTAGEDPFAAFDLFDTGEATHALGYSANDPAMSGENMPYEPDPSGFDVWLEGSFAMVENKDNDSLTGIIYGGADYRFGDQALLGIMGEVDISAESNAVTDTSASGTGWMLGPYAVVRLGDNLYLDGRATYGRSYNQIDPVGLYTDEFTTERLLVQAGITGDFDVGDFVFAPFVRGTYYWERQNAYVDSLSNPIPSQDFDLGRIEFGPHISTVIPMQNYDMALGVGLTGIYDFDKLVDAPPSNPNLASSDHDLRGKLSVDTEIRLPNSNAQIKGEGFYDGIGTGDYLAYGGNLSVLVPF